MKISKLTMAWKYLFGGVGSVVDYLLDILNQALSKVDTKKKEQVQGVLNIAEKVFAMLRSFQWLCPTKWQSAYAETISAVEVITFVMDDFVLTSEEFSKVKATFSAAVDAWKSPDDETCVSEGIFD